MRSVEEFSAEHIVELYKLQENIDVGRYFRQGDTVHLLECLDTGYRFFYPFEAAGDEQFYRELQAAQEEKGLEYDLERADDHRIAFEQIGADEKVLEIGCNTGKFLVMIADKTRNTIGLEFNSAAAQKARGKGVEVTGESIEEHAKNNPEKYDVVCAFQVLEHITAVRSFLTSAIAALKPNGKLLFSVPNNEPYFQRFGKYEVLNLPPHHVGLWNLHSLTKLCDFYEIEMTGSRPTSPSPLVVDAWLRAKLLTGVKSLPTRHTIPEKLMIYSAGPFALLRSSLDYIGDNPNHAFISVSYRKKAKDQVS